MNPTNSTVRRSAALVFVVSASIFVFLRPAQSGTAVAKPGAAVTQPGAAVTKPGETPKSGHPPATPGNQGEFAVEHNNFGIALLAQYKAADAEKEFRAALAADPNYLPALVNVGIAQAAQVRYTEAIASFERALAVDPNNIHAHFNLSLILKLQGKADEGIKHALAAAAGAERDADLHYNLGSLYQSIRDFDGAIREYESALKLDPDLLPAYYSLGRAYIAKGDMENGRKWIQKHQELSAAASLPASSSGLKYGEQGRYSYAMEDLSGREAAAAPLATGEITFTDVTSASGIDFSHAGRGDPLSLRSPLETKGNADAMVRDQVAPFLGSGVGVADIDGDGAEEIILPNTGAKSAGVYLNKGKLTFTSAPRAAAAIPPGVGMAVAAGDVDNDGDADLVLTRYGGVTLLLGDGKGSFAPAPLPPVRDNYFAAGVSLADIDHDGDLDIFVSGLVSPRTPPRDALAFPADFAGEEIRVFRNNGNGAFADVSIASKLGDSSRRSSGAVFADFDNDRDIDVAVARLGQGIGLYTNNRDGTFTDIGAKAGLPTEGAYLGVVAGDYNRDGWVDLLATTWNSSVPRFFRNDGTGSFALDVTAVAEIPREGNGPAFGCAFADVDNDGLLDALEVNGSEKGAAVRLFRNLGTKGFEDATFASGLALIPARRGRGLAVADFDGDGDLDLIVSNNGGPPALLRNDGGNRNHWVTVAATGLNSNRQAVGTKVEVKAGLLWQKSEIASGSGYLSSSSLRPFFGLGKRKSVDTLRLLWPGGVLQDEIRIAADAPFKVEELDRKGTSCPILYSWDGTKMAFVTDFLGGSAFGYLTAPASWNTPDTDEYIRIPADRIRPRDGRYDLRLNNQLEETIYFDRAQLVAVDHPEGTEAYPDEKLVENPPFPSFRVLVVSKPRPPVSAIDEAGRDVTDLVVAEDRRYPAAFANLPFKGYAATHTLTLDLGPVPVDGAVLLMTAWIDYADSTSNLAAAQAGYALAPPSLEAFDPATRSWVTVLHDMGFPAGLPKTMTVDLRGKLPVDSTRVRITTNMRIYWDQIRIGTPIGSSPGVARLDPESAVLRYRGFPLSVMPDGKAPALYDYARDEGSIFWKAHAGAYTRFGDVRPLLLATDDLYVITRGGDEIALSFDATKLKPPAAGMTRTFLLYTDGFGKDMDINSARPDRIEPLPYHAMPSFPYPVTASYPLDELHMQYLDDYNTRRVLLSITPLAP